MAIFVSTTSGAYFFVNEHLVQIANAPSVMNSLVFGRFGSGINNDQQYTLSNGSSLQPAKTYQGTLDPLTGLHNGAGGNQVTLVPPSEFGTPTANRAVALGINESGQIVGVFAGTTCHDHRDFDGSGTGHRLWQW